jgi:hypothetical protein
MQLKNLKKRKRTKKSNAMIDIPKEKRKKNSFEKEGSSYIWVDDGETYNGKPLKSKITFID